MLEYMFDNAMHTIVFLLQIKCHFGSKRSLHLLLIFFSCTEKDRLCVGRLQLFAY